MPAMESIALHGKRLWLAMLATALAIGMAASAVRADTITDDNVEAAVAAAKTTADHEALIAYFTAKSKQALAEVERHKRMANALGSGKQSASWNAHCQSLIKTYEAQAKDYAALAKEQAAMMKGMQHGNQ